MLNKDQKNKETESTLNKINGLAIKNFIKIIGTIGDDNILGTVNKDHIFGMDGGDTIKADAGDDVVVGGNGNDFIEGGTGNDKIYANGGMDTAIFSGSIFDYSWVYPDIQNITITDLNTSDGDDGVDFLNHIEQLQFNDYVFNVAGNNAPLIIADSHTTDEDTSLTFSLLAYDFDGDAVTASIVSASGASVSETGSSPLPINMGSGTDFTFSYDPGSLYQYLAEGESATDQVTIEVSDENGNVSTKVVDITITGVNDNPTPTLIDFEDLDLSQPIYWDGMEIPDGYHGYNWDIPDYGLNLYAVDGDNVDQSTGYYLAGSNVAFTPHAHQPINITRSDGGNFDFESVELTSAWDSSQEVTLEGYLDGNLLYSETVTIYNTSVTDVNVNWGPIDSLIIGNNGSHLILDNFNLVTL